MRHRLRSMMLAAVLSVAMLTVSGCGFTLSPQDLYSLPKLPPEYTELDEQIDQLLASGAENAPPASGNNTQPVQMWDLDGDGQEEAIVFLRDPSDEKPLKIYIFTPEGESYEQTALIEGSGTGFYSINYSDLDRDGYTELLVGWRVNTDLQALSVYSLRSGAPEELMSTYYVRYAVMDLDQDQMQELVVLRSDDENNGLADHYDWQDSGLVSRTSIRISVTMAELNQQGRVTQGALRDGEPALFITGVDDETSTSITDILALRNGELTNLALSDATGVSGEIASFQGLYPTDIDGDGTTEVPRTIALQLGGAEESADRRTDWYDYDAAGSAQRVMSTYHDTDDGWYLRLPEEWEDQITVSRSTAPDEAVVTFSILQPDGQPPKEFLKIYTFTGSSRELKVGYGNRFSLSRQTSTIYAAELLEANSAWAYGVTEDQVRDAFSLITSTDWGADN